MSKFIYGCDTHNLYISESSISKKITICLIFYLINDCLIQKNSCKYFIYYKRMLMFYCYKMPFLQF